TPLRAPSSTLFPYTTLFRSRGVDIQLHSKNIEGTLNWQTDLLYSFINTEVTKYLAEVRGIDQYINGGNVVSPIVGRPLYAISALDRKSTRLNSSHVKISYAV